MKREFQYPSRDGVTQIHAIEWEPEGEIHAVMQLCHGMVEFIDRYDAFAKYLNEHGIYVVGHDHLGHGREESLSPVKIIWDMENLCKMKNIMDIFIKRMEMNM